MTDAHSAQIAGVSVAKQGLQFVGREGLDPAPDLRAIGIDRGQARPDAPIGLVPAGAVIRQPNGQHGLLQMTNVAAHTSSPDRALLGTEARVWCPTVPAGGTDCEVPGLFDYTPFLGRQDAAVAHRAADLVACVSDRSVMRDWLEEVAVEVRREQVAVPSGTIELITLFGVQPYENNVYVVVDPKSGQCLVLDASEAQPILDATAGLQVKAVLITHGHRDHQHQLPLLREQLSVPVGIGPADAGMLASPPEFLIQDGQEIAFGSYVLRAIATPGHTPGGTCFLIGQVLFTGDTLFPGGPGNTSNPYGNFPQVIESIRTRLFTLPDETRVLPGHGRATTIGEERPYLEEWVARGW